MDKHHYLMRTIKSRGAKQEKMAVEKEQKVESSSEVPSDSELFEGEVRRKLTEREVGQRQLELKGVLVWWYLDQGVAFVGHPIEGLFEIGGGDARQ